MTSKRPFVTPRRAFARRPAVLQAAMYYRREKLRALRAADADPGDGGGGEEPSFDIRLTSGGDTRVTSSGDTRRTS